MRLCFVNIIVEPMQCDTYAMDGTRPMTVNPIPKTSNGVKLRLNSVCVVYHACSALVKEVGRPCLYPRLASSSSSLPSATLGSGLDATIEFFALILSFEKMGMTRKGV